MLSFRLVVLAALTFCNELGSCSPERVTSGTVSHLGRPCLSFNILAGLVTKDPATGNDLAVLANNNEEGGELILVDLESSLGERIDVPSGAGAWALQELPGSRIAYGTFYDGVIHVYDLKARKWVRSIDVPGELYVWDFTLGGDGRLYGGTYKGGKLVSLDTETYELKDHGNGAPPNLYCRLIATLPDGRIYCNYRTEKPVIMLFDPKTEEFTTAPERLQGTRDGVLWNELFVTPNKAFTGPDLAEVEWPFRVKTGKGTAPATMDLMASSSGTVYLTHAGKTYLQGEQGTSPTLVTRASVKGQRPIGGRPDGTVVGVRGQQFYTVRPGQDTLNLVEMPVDPKPRPMLFLSLDSGTGMLWGGPEFGQNVFMMNVASGETTNTQSVTHRGGEVYDIDFKNGIAYMVSYVGGEIIAYNPREPWDQVGGVNPKPLVVLEDKGYIRPGAGCTFGPDGKLYAGWYAGYARYGGAVSITDVATGKTHLIENPLGEQPIIGVDVDNKYAYITSGIHGNGLPVMDKAPQFGVLDLETEKLVFQYEFEDYNPESTSQSVPLIVEEMTGRVALSKDGQVRIFDPETMQFVLEDKTARVPGATSFVMTSMHNGKVLFGAKQDVIEMDVMTGEYRVVASFSDGEPFAITADPGGAAYVGVGVDVYEISLVPEEEERS